MDYLIYLTYPILAVLLLYGMKVAKIGQWNDGFMELTQVKAIQGFTAVCIMLHHAGQKTCAPWHNPRYTVHGLDLFVPIGYFFVGVFLFCSGYGLYKSFHEKEHYLKGFFKRRVLPLVWMFYATAVIFLIARIVMGERPNAAGYFYYLTGLMLANPNAWFAIAMPLFYSIFYLAFRYIKKDGVATLVVILGVCLYIVAGVVTDHNNFWLCGEWWYNSAHMFAVGLLFARYEKKLVPHIKKYYAIYLPVAVVGAYVVFTLSTQAEARFGYYGEWMPFWPKVFCRAVTLFSQQVASFLFVAAVFLLHMKVRIGNRVLAFFGAMTLEFYLIHGLFVDLFGYCFISDGWKSLYYIRNAGLFLAVVVVLSIPCALLLKKSYPFGKKNEKRVREEK